MFSDHLYPRQYYRFRGDLKINKTYLKSANLCSVLKDKNFNTGKSNSQTGIS